MRIRRSVRRFFNALMWPAISIAITAYFGYHFLYGPRGYYAHQRVESALADHHRQLANVEDARRRLEHRITLLEPGSVDPDLVEELARTELMDGAPNQIAVPRDTH